jgi:hypothetical protein
MDLDINNYNLEDLFRLFKITELNETTMREAKQIVLKTHPDKSKLESRFFLFYSNAYKQLHEVFEYQNKSKTTNREIEKPTLLVASNDFNKWFNDTFDKQHVTNEVGYGEWLKSDDGLYKEYDHVSKSNMNNAFESQKQKVQALTVYTGVKDLCSKSNSSSLLEPTDNFTDTSYTDLRQAYIESVIPVSQRDFDNVHKYKSVDEYKQQRFTLNADPMHYLHMNGGASLSFQLAQQCEPKYSRAPIN